MPANSQALHLQLEVILKQMEETGFKKKSATKGQTTRAE